jgi:hypothetical protein
MTHEINHRCVFARNENDSRHNQYALWAIGGPHIFQIKDYEKVSSYIRVNTKN